MSSKHILTAIMCSLLITLISSCHHSTEPKPTIGSIKGTVRSTLPGNPIVAQTSYIFVEDSLWVTIHESGEYSISNVNQGNYIFLCSSLSYRDTTVNIKIIGGKTINYNFYLSPDSTTGRIYGEFQDMTLFSQNLETNPDLADWGNRQVFEGVTGATLQTKTMHYDVPDRCVFLGDSLLAYSDAFGQFWLEIQCGTYPITGSCEGYFDKSRVITVLPDTRHYLNFFLFRKDSTELTTR